MSHPPLRLTHTTFVEAMYKTYRKLRKAAEGSVSSGTESSREGAEKMSVESGGGGARVVPMEGPSGKSKGGEGGISELVEFMPSMPMPKSLGLGMGVGTVLSRAARLAARERGTLAPTMGRLGSSSRSVRVRASPPPPGPPPTAPPTGPAALPTGGMESGRPVDPPFPAVSANAVPSPLRPARAREPIPPSENAMDIGGGGDPGPGTAAFLGMEKRMEGDGGVISSREHSLSGLSSNSGFTIVKTNRSLSSSSLDFRALSSGLGRRGSGGMGGAGLAAAGRRNSGVPLKSLVETLPTRVMEEDPARVRSMDHGEMYETEDIRVMYSSKAREINYGSNRRRYQGREGRKRGVRSRFLVKAKQIASKGKGKAGKGGGRKKKVEKKKKEVTMSISESGSGGDTVGVDDDDGGVSGGVVGSGEGVGGVEKVRTHDDVMLSLMGRTKYDVAAGSAVAAVAAGGEGVATGGEGVAAAAAAAGGEGVAPIRRPLASRVGRMRRAAQKKGVAAPKKGAAAPKKGAEGTGQAEKSTRKRKRNDASDATTPASGATASGAPSSGAGATSSGAGATTASGTASRSKRTTKKAKVGKKGFAKVKASITEPEAPKSVSQNYVRLRLNKPGERRGARISRKGKKSKKKGGNGTTRKKAAKGELPAHRGAGEKSMDMGGADFDPNVLEAIAAFDAIPEDDDDDNGGDDKLERAPEDAYQGGMTERARRVVGEWRAGRLDLEEVNKELLGHDRFRPGQREAVERVLEGKSTVVVLPTGSGKSAIYQLPSFLVSGVALVVTPLVSLMADQLENLPSDLIGATINSSQSYEMRKTIETELVAGRISVLFVSPELLETRRFRVLLEKVEVGFVTIDEAHCVSEWSHNFRPSYLRLHQTLSGIFGVDTFLALTATATGRTVEAIIKALGMDGDDESGRIVGGRVPENLQLSAVTTVAEGHGGVDELVRVLREEPFAGLDSIIVYCSKRRTTEEVAARLNADSFSAACYHAGMEPGTRASVQRSFMRGKICIMVATVAFGMGVNKADVRGIIHFNMPKAIENYVQEIGRAGRDGVLSYCHVFVRDSDYISMRSHAYADSVDLGTVKALLGEVFGDGRETRFISLRKLPPQLDMKEGVIETVLVYLSLDQSSGGVGDRPYIRLLPGMHKCAKVWVSERNVTAACAAGVNSAVRGPEYGTSLSSMTNEMLDAMVGKPVQGGPGGGNKSKYASLIQAVTGGVVKRGSWRAMRRYRKGNKGTSGYYYVNLGEVAEKMGVGVDQVRSQLYAASRSKVLMYDLTEWCSAYQVLAHPGKGEEGTSTEVELAYKVQAMLRRLESTQLDQLNAMRTLLDDFTATGNDRALRSAMAEYFGSQEPDTEPGATAPGAALLPQLQLEQRKDSSHVRSDIKVFLRTLEGSISPRAVARIFHGIPSPAYPMIEWRNNHFWGRHLGVEFAELMKAAKAVMLGSAPPAANS